MPEYNENIYKSYRNVPNLCGTLLSDINTYDIVNADTVIFTETAAKIFVEDQDELTHAPEVETEETETKKSKAAKAEAKVETEEPKIEAEEVKPEVSEEETDKDETGE